MILRTGLCLVIGLLLAAAFALSSADPAHALPPLAACENHIDDDNDGATDFPAEPGCSNRDDQNETNPTSLPQCSDGSIDPDLDAKKYPFDPGCKSAADNTEADPATLPQCSDTLENDTDLKVGVDYPADFGCIAASDNSEADTACSDGDDNDGDGKADFPARTVLPFDPGCNAPTGNSSDNPNAGIPNQNDNSEDDPPQCNDGLDNDGDGWVDYDNSPNDPGCTALTDTTEAPNPECSDGVDNDGDKKIDFGSDPGCTSRTDPNELDSLPPPPTSPPTPPACSDTIDNDNDGRIDYPADAGCTSRTDTDETDPGASQPSGRPPVTGSSPAARPLITPFPVVRLRGKADRRGVTITLLRVQAPNGSKITIYCYGRRCPLHKKSQITTSGSVRVRRFERRLRAGSTLAIYVTKSGFTGKYTRFRIRKNRSPSRFDGCARFTGQKPVPCPAN